ncbi:hypothetical protein [Nitrosospira multiformis]|uniref:hypothetical protein n=1 Tax=Nitrosospira multiformis TaxID=1231 RepID=UPI00089B69CA|nr:hypothetical protein [Nitrosospira multiformis]SEA27237.1 nitrogen regulatory protein P-II family [Nitrosospira multiformis]
MKEILAICCPERLHELRRGLRAIPGLTVLEAKGLSAPALIDNPTLREARTP